MGFLSRLLETKSPEEKVWEWFEGHESLLLHLIEKGEELDDFEQERLDNLLKRVSPYLTYYFQKPDESHSWQLIFSVHGIPEAFPAVEQLMAVAPQLQHFEPIGFTPPLEASAPVTLQNEERYFNINPENIFFEVQKEPELKVQVFMPAPLLTQYGVDAAFQFLFEYLGEYRYGQLNEYLVLAPISETAKETLQPIAELRKGLV